MSEPRPRFETRFPVPPVCTAYWTEADWDTWIERHGVTVDREPETLPWSDTHHFVKTGERDAKGEMLYRLTPKGPA